MDEVQRLIHSKNKDCDQVRFCGREYTRVDFGQGFVLAPVGLQAI